jgi:hypothetical protein
MLSTSDGSKVCVSSLLSAFGVNNDARNRSYSVVETRTYEPLIPPVHFLVVLYLAVKISW